MRMKKVYVLLLILFGIVIAYYLTINKKQKDSTVTSVLLSDLDVAYGSDLAPVTVIMFSNYGCSYCKKFLVSVFPLIESKYINTGKVKFIIKIINYSNNAQLTKSYKTSICLNKYGDFEGINKLILLEPEAIFTNQFSDLVEDYIDRNSFFAQCMLDSVADDYLTNNMSQFISSGFTGTPTFIIDNEVFSGYMDFDTFSNIVSEKL